MSISGRMSQPYEQVKSAPVDDHPAFAARVAEARGELKSGYSHDEILRKHGSIVLKQALAEIARSG